MAKINVKLVRSTIKCSQVQKNTLKALGLHKLNSQREHEDNKAILGMVKKVKHLVRIVD